MESSKFAAWHVHERRTGVLMHVNSSLKFDVQWYNFPCELWLFARFCAFEAEVVSNVGFCIMNNEQGNRQQHKPSKRSTNLTPTKATAHAAANCSQQTKRKNEAFAFSSSTHARTSAIHAAD